MEYQLDLNNYLCPLPLLITKRALLKLKVGERLAVFTNHSISIRDFALLCEQLSANILEQQTTEKGHKLIIQLCPDRLR